ncbi:MAG: DUF4347 domain-containing protein [Okeania sp. SIO3B5]|uniref:DUF4347 domain-containing protein n=1 Tax=Okeania sp. SIO3B5 TaxID=2607811 RepID=UPI00140022B8|nr:DUF4347 domain-containing protein [Okeania sp. SIO3B5]NEO55452.1 DUF4347 domain-containing protein [Okeania sp. SIO3B5]
MVLFIDSKVENYDHLISQVNPQTKVVILQPNQNGIDKISKSLGKYHQVETIHIISHGAKGTLYLGNSILNLNNIHQYTENIQKWGKCLSAGAEILIYGCQVARGKEGKEFVRQLHQITGANIAASETLTGNANKGGNWNLEIIFGQLKSALAFTPEVRASYAGVLANIVVDTTNDVVDNSDGVTSLREAIIEANSTPEDDTIQLTAGVTYNLTIAGSEEDGAATGDLDIVAGGGEITVISQGEEQTTIDAGGETGIGDRVFHVLENGWLQLENVGVTGGRLSGSFSAGAGAGIFNLGTAIINNSMISSNGSSGTGGGINNSGTAIINNSNISGNDSSGTGGGINNSGTVNISNSTISSNSANSAGGGGINNSGTVNISNSTISANYTIISGGGIYNNNFGTISISNSIISSNFGGGGIYNTSATININNSTISGNSGAFGGGIGLGTAGVNDSGGTVNINNSTISGNEAGFGGGGIGNSDGTVNLSHSTISNNSAEEYGGGIFNSGTVNINNSTISDNSASGYLSYGLVYGGYGGGIYNLVGIASIKNSTISGNSADYGGGGISNSGGTAIISNSTITGNEAPSDLGSGILQKTYLRRVYDGNNYYDKSYYSSSTVTSSIVSGNINSDVDSVENNNTLTSGDNNLIGTGNAINDFNGDNDQTGITNPLLGDLADNGGPTLTHLPLPDSPAIDAGSNPNALTTDQRGEPRFVGEGVDIGAVELQNSPQITGTPQSDRLNGTNENNTIIGLAGNDTINGRGGDDQIIGSQGNDFLYGQDGDDTLEGRQGSDRLFGGNGNDSLVGGIGRDRFNGGAGNDTLTGGASIDRFIFATNDEFDSDDLGVDDITDFAPGQDIILLDKSTFTAITSNSGVGFSINIEFAIVTSDAEAETSSAVIVYNSNNGKLFYNANGTEAEFGSGGEFANLTNTASISEDDFLLRG